MSNRTTALIEVEDTTFSMPQDGRPRRTIPLLEIILHNAQQIVNLSVEEKTVLGEVKDILENHCVNVQANPDTDRDYDHIYKITKDDVFETV